MTACLAQRLLADKSRVSKLLLYTYMRGGSSVFSQLFNIGSSSVNKSTVLFFEPLDSFYSMFFGLRQFNLPLAVNYYPNLTRRRAYVAINMYSGLDLTPRIIVVLTIRREIFICSQFMMQSLKNICNSFVVSKQEFIYCL